MPKLCCRICLSSWVDPPNLCSVSCGHVFCRSCITRYIETCEDNDVDTFCPTCRFIIEYDDLRPVYLTFEDEPSSEGSSASASVTLLSQLKRIKTGLSKIKAGVPESSVTTAGDLIRDLGDACVDIWAKDVLEQLLSVIVNFIKNQIAPVFREVDEERRSRIRLETNCVTLSQRCSKLEDRLKGQDHVSRELRGTLDALHSRLAGEEALRRDNIRLTEENIELSKKTKAYWDAMCDCRNKRDAKIKKLKQENKDLRIELEEKKSRKSNRDEDSLLVCDNNEDANAWPDIRAHGTKRQRIDGLDATSFEDSHSSREFGYPADSISPTPSTRHRVSRTGPWGASLSPDTAPPTRGPTFSSDWQMSDEKPADRLRNVMKRASSSNTLPFPGVDAQGRPGPRAALVTGDRRRMGPGGKV